MNAFMITLACLLLGIPFVVLGFLMRGWLFKRCESKLGPTRCEYKRGHARNHRGTHWSKRTLYWRELDTSQLQELLNAIRRYGSLRVWRAGKTAEAWESVDEKTAQIQSCIDGSRTAGG